MQLSEREREEGRGGFTTEMDQIIPYIQSRLKLIRDSLVLKGTINKCR